MSKKLDVSKLTLGMKKEIKKENLISHADDKIENVVRIIHNESLTNANIEPTKRTTLDIPKSLHKMISQRALDKELYLKDYFLELVRKDLGME